MMWDVAAHFSETERNYINLIKDFEKLRPFPYSFGEIGGCHIPIKYPPRGQESAKEYHNFKNVYSIVQMAIFDDKYRFLWADCVIYGNSYDFATFQESELYLEIIENNIITNIGNIEDGQVITRLLVGDSAFPFRTLSLKPFTKAILTPEQRYFS